MADPNTYVIQIARAQQRLEQEQIAFDLVRIQNAHWFALQMAVGISAVMMYVLIGAVATWVVLHRDEFNGRTLGIASGALFVDMLTIVWSVQRVVLGEGPRSLRPTTGVGADT